MVCGKMGSERASAFVDSAKAITGLGGSEAGKGGGTSSLRTSFGASCDATVSAADLIDSSGIASFDCGSSTGGFDSSFGDSTGVGASFAGSSALTSSDFASSVGLGGSAFVTSSEVASPLATATGAGAASSVGGFSTSALGDSAVGETVSSAPCKEEYANKLHLKNL